MNMELSLLANFNIDNFISEVHKYPVIWDTLDEDFKNKLSKRKAWEDVIIKFYPKFKDEDNAYKNHIASWYQRKWKGLRNSFMREKAKQKDDSKYGSAAKFRKQYVYFEQMSFLDTKTNLSSDSIINDNDDDISGAGYDSDPRIQIGDIDTDITVSSKKEKRYLRTSNESDNEEFLRFLKTNYYKRRTKTKQIDEDKMFLLSLYSDFKQIPQHMKLDVKIQIIEAIKMGRQTSSALPHSVQGASVHSKLPNNSDCSSRSSEPDFI